MNSNSMLKDFMAFDSNDEILQKYFDNKKNFLNDQYNKLAYDDLFKFCETILKFSSSDKAVSCLDGLVILQTFLQRLSKILFNYMDKNGDDDNDVISVSSELLFYMMKNYSPKYIWDELLIQLPYLNVTGKEFMLDLLEQTFTKFGINCLDHEFIISCLTGLKQDINLEKKLEIKITLLIRYLSKNDTFERKIQADLNENILKLEIELENVKNTLSKTNYQYQELQEKFNRLNIESINLKLPCCNSPSNASPSSVSPSKSSDNESLKENKNNLKDKRSKQTNNKYDQLLISNLDCNTECEQKWKSFIVKAIKKKTTYSYRTTNISTNLDNFVKIYYSCCEDKNSICNSKLKSIINKKTNKVNIYSNREPHSHSTNLN